jgi:tryptophan-rich sensory protein
MGALLEKFEDVIVRPIDDVYVKNSKEDMLDTAFSQPFCRNYYTIQMLRFVVFIIIMFELQNSSWAQIILSTGMAIIICGLTIKFQRMGCLFDNTAAFVFRIAEEIIIV